MKDIIFDDFSSAFGLLKEVKKGTVQPSGDKFIWSCQQAMTEAEKKIVVMHTPFDQMEMPTCPLTLYKGRVIHQETGDLDWCIPDSKIRLEAGYSREQVGVAKRICKLHNEAEYLGYSDWRLPTIYELSIFEDQELAELLGKDKKKYWTSNKVETYGSNYDDGCGVLGYLGSQRIINQRYHDSKKSWSSCGNYLSFEGGGYSDDGEVILVRSRTVVELSGWSKELHEWATDNKVHMMPDTLDGMMNLKELDLCTSAKSLPDVFSNLVNLEYIEMRLADCFPEVVYQLPNLKRLMISTGSFNFNENGDVSIEDVISNLHNLEEIKVEGCEVIDIHENFYQLTKLTSIDFTNNNIVEISESIQNLKKLKSLKLARNDLKSLPDAIGELSELETLEFSSRDIRSLPESIGKLKKLQKIESYFSGLSSLPQSIGELTKLKELTINNCDLKELPESMQKLEKLEKLMITNTAFENIPCWFVCLTNLKFLSVAKSKVTEIPDWLAFLPNLERVVVHHSDFRNIKVNHELFKENGIKIGTATF
ncbi:leucine-rich repeat domain-containing protein [Vibrio sp. B172a]|uniref:leucine-rich repeat domain-containing protein n=1 Tax=Vibrio sp. B172a TaxID=2835790 RepID=UPI0025556DD8|nr:hypothetical protein [Vibrio sp. B172a]MDK9783391.1 leucine-rich repeat domain-containing protein [Vibrio sp. B172a]